MKWFFYSQNVIFIHDLILFIFLSYNPQIFHRSSACQHFTNIKCHTDNQVKNCLHSTWRHLLHVTNQGITCSDQHFANIQCHSGNQVKNCLHSFWRYLLLCHQSRYYVIGQGNVCLGQHFADIQCHSDNKVKNCLHST